jgi:DNA gyrase subunit B
MAQAYSAEDLQVLEGLEAVRKRPGMYIGSTDSRGLMHCLWEIIDNSVDEALGGHGAKIDIVLHQDGSVEVRDEGRGVPIDIEPRTGWSGVQVVYTKLHAGGKFGSSNYGAAGGLHGVGASVVNALSSRLDVEVDRGGKTYAMSFQRGHAGVFADSGEPSPDAAFTEQPGHAELRVVGKVGKNVTGTRVRYWADPQVFVRDAAFQLEQLRDRARQTAFLVPGHRAGVVQVRRRYFGVRRVPRAGRGPHRHLADGGGGALPRDRARARRQDRPHGVARGRAPHGSRPRPALGCRLRHR